MLQTLSGEENTSVSETPLCEWNLLALESELDQWKLPLDILDSNEVERFFNCARSSFFAKM